MVVMGIYWGFGRANKRSNRSMEDIAGSQKDGNEDQNLLVLRDELNWTAHEAEVANLRSELLLHRLIHFEEDIVKIKESIKMALEVSMEINEKIGRLEGQLNSEKRRKQVVSSVNIAKEVSISHGSTTQLSYLERQVLDLLSTNGPMGTLEIKGKIGRSREHVSRLLGKLVDRGIVGRSRTGRQVIYDVNHYQSNIQKDDEEKAGSSTPSITTSMNASGENELKGDNESVHTHP